MAKHTDPQRDRELLEHLDEDTLRLLFPERFQAPVRVTFVYAPLGGEQAAAAQAALANATVERGPAAEQPGSPVVERASFDLAHVEQAHALFELLSSARPPEEVEVLIDGKRLPMVRELWLPLLWNLRD